MKRMDKVFTEHVNYVPLYQAFRFNLVRAFCKGSESGVNNDKDQWRDLNEVQTKKNKASPLNEDQKNTALNEVHTFHARFLVEYVPLTDIKGAI
jgi:hypothetical protein